MNSLAIASIVFTCVFGGALLGLVLRRVLPDDHLGSDSKDVVKLAMGLVATMAALALGLLTGSAKSTFDEEDGQLKQVAANVVLLDRTLAHYGPETNDARESIRRLIASRLSTIWPEEGAGSVERDDPEATAAVERIDDQIRALSPQNDTQRTLQGRASETLGDVIRTRWLLLGEAGNSVQRPLLVVLVFWLAALFISFGLFAPRNPTVVTVLAVAAISVAGSIFLILEMNQPFTGFVKISSAPLRFALAHLGQ
ncbi:MAG TPA: hypothetical protein VGR62_15015 [Candidatus Binatia bacterium]|jgi:hypothetical protein|nr:hypothetical protein [Candidatus Binatia bacterium]